MLTKWFEVADRRFEDLILPNVHVDTLFSESRWLEGSVYVPAARYLLVSDIPNDRVLRYDETDGSVATFCQPSNFANGHTLDRLGRVLACEHSSRSVTRMEHNGAVTVVASSYQGKRLNSPNDLVESLDDSIWFTDPTYGISTEYEGVRCESEIGARNVYRVDPSGQISVVLADLIQPNGLAFSLEEKTLYVVDSGSQPARIDAFSVGEDGSLSDKRLIRLCENGAYDGIGIDRLGNIWASAGDGVHCIAPDGTLLGKILIPEVTANLCLRDQIPLRCLFERHRQPGDIGLALLIGTSE
jgi:gluconolactonase